MNNLCPKCGADRNAVEACLFDKESKENRASAFVILERCGSCRAHFAVTILTHVKKLETSKQPVAV